MKNKRLLKKDVSGLRIRPTSSENRYVFVRYATGSKEQRTSNINKRIGKAKTLSEWHLWYDSTGNRSQISISEIFRFEKFDRETSYVDF